MKKFFGEGRWRYRAMELAVAMVLVLGIIHFTNLLTAQYRASVPPNAWLAINEIFVPDYASGENPTMIYDRTVRQEFSGMWVVEVQHEEEGALFSPACIGSGVTNYRTDVVIPANRVKWDWFIGKPCVVPPGRYRLRATWTIQVPGWPEKKTSTTSNIFTVSALPGNQTTSSAVG